MNLKLPVVLLFLLPLCLLPLCLLVVLTAWAAEEEGASRLDQSLTDLAGDLRAMSLAARPGGEDLELLALLRRRDGVRTWVTLATAGEGVGAVPPWGRVEAQRRIRIGEARRAARGVDARFDWLHLPDYGITRSGEEFLTAWDRDHALRSLVTAIRAIRPHLVVMDHRDQERRGAAEAAETLVKEAFVAAGDPMQYPEAGSVWNTAWVLTACDEADAEITVNTGAVDLERGISYARMASIAREAYQAVELSNRDPVVPGPRLRHYRVTAAAIEGSPRSLPAVLPLPRPQWLKESSRAKTREEILEVLRTLREAPEEDRPPAERVEDATLAALNLTLSISAADRTLIEDQPGGVRFSLVNGGTRTVTLQGIRVDPHDDLGIENPEIRPAELAPDDAAMGKFWVVPAAESVGDLLLTVRATVRLGEGEPLTLRTRAPFEVLPAVTIEVLPWTRLIRPVDHSGVLQVVVTNHTDEEMNGPLLLAMRGTDRVELTPPESVRVRPGDSVLVPVQIILKDEVDLGLFSLHLSYADHFHQDIFRIADVNVPLEMRVGVVGTETDASFQALRALRILPVKLSDVDLQTLDLSVLDTILIGERPFFYRPALKRIIPRLVEFVKAGGNLFLNYSRPSEWEGQALLPKFTYGTERVTREDAELILTEMDARLFNVPNKIESGDFEGWVLERGRYFPADLDENHYQVLMRCADPHRPLQPAILVSKLGKGLVIQSSLTWRPQIENLNPGALKFLANLVSLPWYR